MYFDKTYVKYLVYSNGAVVKGGDAYYNCYANFTGGIVNGVVDKIEIFCKKEWPPFTETQIKKAVKLFCKMGFNVSFEEVQDEYKFTVLFEDTPEQQSRLYITAILFMIRYIWHDGLTRIMQDFLDIASIKGTDPFMSMQLAHNYFNTQYGNYNHMLFSYHTKPSYLKPTTFENFLNVASKSPKVTHLSVGITANWIAMLEETVKPSEPKNYEEYYNKVINNK